MTESLQAAEATTPDAVVADKAPQSSPAEDVKQEAEEGDNAEQQSSADEKPKEELSEADKVRHAMEKRLARKTAAEKAALERVKKLEAQLAEMPKQEDTSDAPQEDDFDTWEEYDQARIRYEAKKFADKQLREAREAELKRTQQQQQAERQKAFEAKESAFVKANPDYKEKSSVLNEVFEAHMNVNGGTTPTLQAVATLLAESEVAPALIHHLGGDDTLAEDLLNMSPVDAMREMFKLESAVNAQPKKDEKDLPPPISKTKGKGTVKSESNMTGAELRKKYGLV